MPPIICYKELKPNSWKEHFCLVRPGGILKEKDSILDEFEEFKNEIIRDKVSDIFRKHPKDYIAKLEELGFKYFEDEDDDSEEIEERNAKPENQRQRDLL